LTEILESNLAFAPGLVAVLRPVKGTFLYGRVIQLVTKVEEGAKVVLENENGTENIAACPCGGMTSGSYYS
jgi:hypothetical protein